MFGCYRRGDANNPDIYVKAVSAVLARYPVEIVWAVTDPINGLPSRKNDKGYSGLPDVADVKEACENEATRIARMARYAAMPRTQYPRLRPPPASPGAWATIHVLPDTPHYARMLKVITVADKRKWRNDDRGLWVSHDLLDAPLPGDKPKLEKFKPYTEAELREKYGMPAQQAAE